jgi:hypothetical protein
MLECEVKYDGKRWLFSVQDQKRSDSARVGSRAQLVVGGLWRRSPNQNLTINLKTARVIDLDIPDEILEQADTIIR